MRSGQDGCLDRLCSDMNGTCRPCNSTNSAVTSGHKTSTKWPSSLSSLRHSAAPNTMTVGLPRMLVFHMSPCFADLCSLEGRWHHMILQETGHYPASSCLDRISLSWLCSERADLRRAECNRAEFTRRCRLDSAAAESRLSKAVQGCPLEVAVLLLQPVHP